jgi:hypothetical protein
MFHFDPCMDGSMTSWAEYPCQALRAVTMKIMLVMLPISDETLFTNGRGNCKLICRSLYEHSGPRGARRKFCGPYYVSTHRVGGTLARAVGWRCLSRNGPVIRILICNIYPILHRFRPGDSSRRLALLAYCGKRGLAVLEAGFESESHSIAITGRCKPVNDRPR